MAAEFYSINAGLGQINPQAVVQGTSAPTADVYVQVLTSGASGTITKMQVRLILDAIMQAIEARGVGTQYQTDFVPALHP